MKFAAVVLLMLAASIGAFAQDEAEVANFGGRLASTAWDIISQEPTLSTLKTAVEANNLVAALNNTRRGVTVFAPTNTALAALLAALPAGTPLASPLVTNILLQHVTRSRFLVPLFPIGRSVTSLNPGNSITRVSSTTGRRTINPSRASWRGGQNNTVNSTRAINALKASVIVIDGVILPNNAFASVQAIAAFYNYTSLASAVVANNLLDAVNAVDPQKTVFGPNNAAFADVASVVGSLTAGQVKDVLTYHVSDSVIAAPFQNNSITTRLFPATLNLVAPSTVVAAKSRATIATPNIYFPGGVFQGIDAVLIPF